MDRALQSNYYKELMIRIQQAGYTARYEQDGLLSVELDGHPLCRITGGGSIRYRQEDVQDLDTQSACNHVTDLASMTMEYMMLMDTAPDLKADGLGEHYKLLSDFNGAVLAGHPSECGIQFVTWEWGYGRTSLWQGHYYGNNYEGAKQDFAVRAGLIQKNQLFSDEQLTEIYRCVHETLESEYPITAERQKLLEDTAEQIERAVSNLEELVSQSNQKELEVAEEPYQGMTQQI